MEFKIKIDDSFFREIERRMEKVVKKELKVNNKNCTVTKNVSNDEELLTRKDVMKMLGISHSTLYHYQQNYIIPYFKIGNRVYFKKKDILDNTDLLG